MIEKFSCPGIDTNGSIKLIGGMRKGRPNKEDLEKARNFARDLLKKLGAENKPA